MSKTTETQTLVIRSAGTNCDAEMVRAFEIVGSSVELVHIDALVRDPSRLASCDVIGFPGGFSYGDDIAAGRVLASKVRERLAGPLRDASERGVTMIGVCNGFQVLVQAGLLPGSVGARISLVANAGGRFIDDWPRVEVPESNCVWTRDITGSAHAMRLPIANGEGRFVSGEPGALEALEASGQVAIRYVDNLNGSEGAVAGICDPSGRIFGLMPHPERSLNWRHHPYWTRLGGDETGDETVGLRIFRNGVEAASGVGA
jgi:phosphoribosylformylglycinamidine synthase